MCEHVTWNNSLGVDRVPTIAGQNSERRHGTIICMVGLGSNEVRVKQLSKGVDKSSLLGHSRNVKGMGSRKESVMAKPTKGRKAHDPIVVTPSDIHMGYLLIPLLTGLLTATVPNGIIAHHNSSNAQQEDGS